MPHHLDGEHCHAVHSGQRALEGGWSVATPWAGSTTSKPEQWLQALEDLLASDAGAQPLVQRQPRSEVRRRIPCNDRVEVLILTLPEAVWELSLGIYLIVKGFRPSPILHDDGPTPEWTAR